MIAASHGPTPKPPLHAQSKRLGSSLPDAKHPATVRRILAAAEATFAARGLAGARIDEIARSARVNKALLYYYFGSKKKLYRAAFENLLAQASQSIQAVMPPRASTRQVILAFVEGYFHFRIANPNYARLMQHVMMENPQEFHWLARQYFNPGFKQLTETIRQGIACGEFQRIDPGHTVINLLAMIVFYFSGAPVHSVLLGRNALEPAAIAAHQQAIVDLLEHGLFRNPAGKGPAKAPARRQMSVRKTRTGHGSGRSR